MKGWTMPANGIAGRPRVALKLTTSLGLIALAIPGVAKAQQVEANAQGERAQDDPDATAAAPQSGLADIVVTARRSSENVQRVPIAITTVTGDSLINNSVRDIIDVQKVTPGLYISSQNSGGRAKLAIRGQTEAGSLLSTDGSAGVYIDGVPIVRSYGLRASMVDIAQIEVLKGPQGTLFGKNTTGGALNITTEQPVYERGGYFDLVYGSYQNIQALAVINQPIVQDKAALRIVGQRIKRDGYGKIANGQQIGDDDLVYGRATLRLDPVEDLTISLTADYAHQSTNGTNIVLTGDSMLQNANTATRALGSIAAQLGLNPGSAADRLTAYNAWRTYFDQFGNQYSRDGVFQDGFSTEPVFDKLTHYGFAGTISYDFGGVTAKSITAFRKLDRALNQDFDGTPFSIFQTYTATRQQNFSQEFQLSSIDQFGLDWQVGLFFNRESGNEIQANNPLVFTSIVNPATGAVSNARAQLLDVDVTNISKAAYAQAVYNFGSRFRITAGLRYTLDDRKIESYNRADNSFATAPISPASGNTCFVTVGGGSIDRDDCSYRTSTDSKKLTYLLTADWRVIDPVMLYVSASSGYRAGGYSLQAATRVAPTRAALDATFAPFEPETVENYEFGFKSDLLDRRLRINGAAFYQNYSDIQVAVRDSVDGLPINLVRNAAKARLYGGEIEITGEVTPNWIVQAGGSYLNAKYNSYEVRDASGNLVDFSNQDFPSPKYQYNLGTTYTIPLSDGELRFNANLVHLSRVNFRPGGQFPDQITQPGYSLLDARVSWQIESAGVTLAVFGKNLTNKQYLNGATNVESIGYNIGFPGDPRVFGVQFRKNF